MIRISFWNWSDIDDDSGWRRSCLTSAVLAVLVSSTSSWLEFQPVILKHIWNVPRNTSGRTSNNKKWWQKVLTPWELLFWSFFCLSIFLQDHDIKVKHWFLGRRRNEAACVQLLGESSTKWVSSHLEVPRGGADAKDWRPGQSEKSFGELRFRHILVSRVPCHICL